MKRLLWSNFLSVFSSKSSFIWKQCKTVKSWRKCGCMANTYDMTVLPLFLDSDTREGSFLGPAVQPHFKQSSVKSQNKRSVGNQVLPFFQSLRAKKRECPVVWEWLNQARNRFARKKGQGVSLQVIKQNAPDPPRVLVASPSERYESSSNPPLSWKSKPAPEHGQSPLSLSLSHF